MSRGILTSSLRTYLSLDMTSLEQRVEALEQAVIGQLHHHLRALVAAGWLTSTGRGRWSIPAPRVIPLLVVVAATTG
jgi:hypothetical protein